MSWLGRRRPQSRVDRWAGRLDDPHFELAGPERELHDADHLRMTVDSSREDGLTVLFRDLYPTIAPVVAERSGAALMPVEAVRIRYDVHLRRVHADALPLAGGYVVKLSADLIHLLYAFIRNLSTMVTFAESPLATEPGRIVASRIARALDMAAAPMFWPNQYWSSVEEQRALAESFVQSAERFVLGHEITHMYLTDAAISTKADNWSTMPRRARQQTKELMADSVSFDGLVRHASLHAEEHDMYAPHVALHAMTGSLLALATVDLLERFDDEYAVGDHPRAALRRIALRKLVAAAPQYSDHLREWESLADSQARAALTIALRRRTTAGAAVDDLLSEHEGRDWSDVELATAVRRCLRHSRSATLDRLAAVRADPARYSERIRRLVHGFIAEHLILGPGEPIYLPFLEDIQWGTDE